MNYKITPLTGTAKILKNKYQINADSKIGMNIKSNIINRVSFLINRGIAHSIEEALTNISRENGYSQIIENIFDGNREAFIIYFQSLIKNQR